MSQEIYDTQQNSISPIQSVKRFYFLDYFYILLESINRYKKSIDVFESFLSLKQRYRLGESKYKKLTADTEDMSEIKIRRYVYTFGEVFDEALEYNLIIQKDSYTFYLTKTGIQLLQLHKDKGPQYFNQALLLLMEDKYGAFRHLINILYQASKKLPGLLVLPSYSPRQLGFERSRIKTTGDIHDYSLALIDKLESDIQTYIGGERDLSKESHKLFKRLINIGLLPKDFNSQFNPTKYNVITKRFRDFWMNYFLKKIYRYDYSMSSFDIWTYRGKQIGIIHATEFHPYFHGKIVYPLSVIEKTTRSKDFTELYKYPDGYKLYVHKPLVNENQERFVDSLVKAYFDLRRASRNYFVNVLAIREIVCINMKISEKLFEDFLDITYKLNLAGELQIRISLEVDKLPEETRPMYLKQEPVMVDGKYRNIIAIDVSKEE